MSTHSLHLLLRKWRSVSWCGWFRMKRWWESLIETSLWQQERCLLPAKLTESRRYMLRGAVKWLFHGRTVNRRYTATDRFYLMQWPNVAEKYCQVMEANESKGCIRTLEPGEIDDGPIESWVPTSFFCSERRQRDYQREDSFRFNNQIWQNKP